MKLALYSITYHNCPVDVREKVSFTVEQRRSMLKKMHAEPRISEAVILQTCNRSEFYTYAKKDFDVGGFWVELIGQVRPEVVDTWCKYSQESVGIDAVRHLFEVAAGLDSQMIGENQILSQVKSTYTKSIDCRMSKFMFHRLLKKISESGDLSALPCTLLQPKKLPRTGLSSSRWERWCPKACLSIPQPAVLKPNPRQTTTGHRRKSRFGAGEL